VSEPQTFRAVVEYEKEYADTMAEILHRSIRASLHSITSPYWDAVSYALTHYDPSYPRYDKKSVITDAISLARSKLRGETRYELIDRLSKALEGLLEFLLDYSEHYPSQKVWEVARAIRRSLAELYYESVWQYIQERQRKKQQNGATRQE